MTNAVAPVAVSVKTDEWRTIAIGDDDPDEPTSYRELASALLSDFERYAEDETSERRMVSVRAYKEGLDRIDARARRQALDELITAYKAATPFALSPPFPKE